MSQFTEWQDKAVASLKGKPFEKTMHQTLDNIAFHPLYAVENGAQTYAKSQAAYFPELWSIAQRVVMTHEDIIPDALTVMEQGASALTLSVQNSVDKSTWRSFLEPLYLDMIQIRLSDCAGRAETVDEFLEAVEQKAGDKTLDINLGLDPIAQIAKTGGFSVEQQNISVYMQSILQKSLNVNKGIKPFLLDTRPYAEAGASPVLELAIALATLHHLIECVGESFNGDIADICEILLTLDADLFGTISKFRAMRILVANLWKASQIEAKILDIHGEMGAHILSALDENVNMLRASAATFGGIIGGAKSITLYPHTLLSDPNNALANRIIRNIQLMYQEESHLGHVQDPAAGSAYLETRTEEIAKAAWEHFVEIQNAGGILEMLTSGKLSETLEENFATEQKLIALRKRPLTGSSEFANPADKVHDLAMGSLKNDAIPPLHHYGEALKMHRRSEAFENLRYKGQEDEHARITLLTIGTPAAHSARLNFAQNAFTAIGLRCSVAAEILAIGDNHPHYICLCGSDEGYLTNAQALVKEIRETYPQAKIMIAGQLSGDLKVLQNLGFAEQVAMGVNLIDLADRIFSK